MQALEDALPYDRHKQVREDIPVGVYDVIADFGQSRGGNTATNLPNEALSCRAATAAPSCCAPTSCAIPELFAGGRAASRQAAVAPAMPADLTADGNFHRTLWHEVGHYLGVDRTADGPRPRCRIGADANLLEEMKADLVSLFAARSSAAAAITARTSFARIYASGILRTLQNNRPRREQPYRHDAAHAVELVPRPQGAELRSGDGQR